MKQVRHNNPHTLAVPKSIWSILLTLHAIQTALALTSSWLLQPHNVKGVRHREQGFSHYDRNFGQPHGLLIQHHHSRRQRHFLYRRVDRTEHRLQSDSDCGNIRTFECDDDQLLFVPEAKLSPTRSSHARETLNSNTRRKIIQTMLSWGGSASLLSLPTDGAEASPFFSEDVNDMPALPASSVFLSATENEPQDGNQNTKGGKESYHQTSSTPRKPRRNYHPLKSSVVQKLWDLDDNRLIPNRDYKINIQAGKTLRRKEPNSNSRSLEGNTPDNSGSDLSFGDVAPLPLFDYVNPLILSNDNSPPLQQQQDSQSASHYNTYRLFRSLLDNYNADESIPETTTDQEYDEIMSFLNAIMDTRPMQFCHEYCYHRQIELMKKTEELEHANGGEMQLPTAGVKKQIHERMIVIPPDREGFIQLLYSIWFDYYRRQRSKNSVTGKNSCGFEHVFVGEVKPTRKRATVSVDEIESVNTAGKSDENSDMGTVVGFHNWIQFYLEEQKGNLDYRGFIVRPGSSSRDGAGSEESNTGSCSLDHTQNTRVLTLQFKWNGNQKPLSTMFVGTSPEFEMALYTMAFLVGETNNRVTLDTTTTSFADDGGGSGLSNLNIKCFRIGGEGEEPDGSGFDLGMKGIIWQIGSTFVEHVNQY